MCVGAKSRQGVAEWREKFNLADWASEIRAVEKEVRASQNAADGVHLRKILMWTRLLRVVGMIFAFFTPNPIAVVCISSATFARWAMVGHHVGHGGYDKIESQDSRFRRRAFALGSFLRRVEDWLDWMLPEAWDVEHNHLHHYQLGEIGDPDLVERNMQSLRQERTPMWVRYLTVGFFIFTWKWSYYSPNTLKHLFLYKKKLGKGSVFPKDDSPITLPDVFEFAIKGNMGPLIEVSRVMLPVLFLHLLALPLVFYCLGMQRIAWNLLINLVLADLFSNMHSFMVIVPNHTGHDVYRFDSEVEAKSDEFFLRAVIGSVNYATGSDMNDYIYGWLNYQIEHHLWPDMSMSAYQRAQPMVKQICEKHGVPYVQESCLLRVKKTVDIMVGKASMKNWERGD
ncbi:hypothetical protein CYMTET_54495 [Cymbomonas tetramitiformis]|uniref:Fatty acid desaturase domain-containing protein n=2 Tax=Cymbomonas tetramitiformis TaxID=36881 RepID=A0AAE0BG25_9CHLO|nr:hypothetical protein CYMTET_54495 [Cymbomonas tetramitiformis]